MLWYYATFGPTGGPPTLEVKASAKGCYTAAAFDDTGKAAAVAGLVWHVGSKKTVSGLDRYTAVPGAASRCAGARDGDRCRPLERSEVRAAVVLARRARARRLRRGRARARDGDAVGDSRPWRQVLFAGTVPAGLDGDPGRRAEVQGDDALRRALRAVDQRGLRIAQRTARLVLLRERRRGRSQRHGGDAARRATCSGGTIAAGAAAG